MPVGGVAVGGTAMCEPGKARMFCALDIADLEDLRVGASVEKEPKASPSLEPNLARVEEHDLNRFPTLYTYLILIPVRMHLDDLYTCNRPSDPEPCGVQWSHVKHSKSLCSSGLSRVRRDSPHGSKLCTERQASEYRPTQSPKQRPSICLPN